MNARAATRAAALVLLAAVVVVALVGRLSGVAGDAAAATRDFTVTSESISSTVQPGQLATYQLAVAPVAGFTGKVSLSASGLPAGTTATFSPSSLTLGAGASASTLRVTTTGVPTGSTSFVVTGTSGSTRRALGLTVVVAAPTPAGVSVAVTPASLSVAPGATASYAVAVSRLNGYAGTFGLSVSGALPTGASMTLSPSTIPEGLLSPVAATLTISTSAATPGSSTELTVTARGTSAGAAISSSAAATLVVDTTLSAKPFTIAGTATGALAPGVAPSPIDLAVTNPNNQPLSITNLGVTVTGTTRSGCAAADFAVRQYAGSYPLTVAARGQGVRLTSLGVPVSALPTVGLLDRPGDQDACLGVTVRLSYTGSATNR